MYRLNAPRMFQNTCVIETELSDFHLFDSDGYEENFNTKKIRPRVINYGSYRDFFNKTFRVSPIKNLSNEVSVNNDDGLEKFCSKQMPFMTKNLF